MAEKKTTVQITEDNIEQLNIKVGTILKDKDGIFWKITNFNDFTAGMKVCDKDGNELQNFVGNTKRSIFGGGLSDLLNDGVTNYFIEIEQQPEVEKDIGYNFFVKDTAEFEHFEQFEPIKNLTAEEAVKTFIEHKNKNFRAGIGINITDDFIFNDPNCEGAIVLDETKGKVSFYMGDSFVKELKENNEHSQNVIKAFKELDEAIKKSSIFKDGLYEEPTFLFNKEKELGLTQWYETVDWEDPIESAEALYNGTQEQIAYIRKRKNEQIAIENSYYAGQNQKPDYLDENRNSHLYSDEENEIYEGMSDEELVQTYKQKYPDSSLSISEDTRKELENVFSKIDDYLDKETVPEESRFTLPKTPSYLQEVGSDETVISLPVSVIKKAKETHGLSNEEIKNSLLRFYDPVVVFDSDKTKSENKQNSKLILTDEFAESKPIALAVNTNADIRISNGKQSLEVQDIRSIHDRTLIAKNGTDLINQWTENGLCRYVDDKKITDWSNVSRVYFPIDELQSDTNNIILKSKLVNSVERKNIDDDYEMSKKEFDTFTNNLQHEEEDFLQGADQEEDKLASSWTNEDFDRTQRLDEIVLEIQKSDFKMEVSVENNLHKILLTNKDGEEIFSEKETGNSIMPITSNVAVWANDAESEKFKNLADEYFNIISEDGITGGDFVNKVFAKEENQSIKTSNDILQNGENLELSIEEIVNQVEKMEINVLNENGWTSANDIILSNDNARKYLEEIKSRIATNLKLGKEGFSVLEADNYHTLNDAFGILGVYGKKYQQTVLEKLEKYPNHLLLPLDVAKEFVNTNQNVKSEEITEKSSRHKLALSQEENQNAENAVNQENVSDEVFPSEIAAESLAKTELTSEDFKNARVLLPKEQYQVVLGYTQGEEGEHFKNIIKEISSKAEAIKGKREILTEDEKHPLAFKYTIGASSFYFSEWNGEDELFGYVVLNGNTQDSEWGYTSLEELKNAGGKDINGFPVMPEMIFYGLEDTIEKQISVDYPELSEKMGFAPKLNHNEELISEFGKEIFETLQIHKLEQNAYNICCAAQFVIRTMDSSEQKEIFSIMKKCGCKGKNGKANTEYFLAEVVNAENNTASSIYDRQRLYEKINRFCSQKKPEATKDIRRQESDYEIEI